uniref:Uncharacterized protein n=1 Tax=Micrurus surinamensis TaxID=129470 RepID=A0A2D4NUU0_MICSU
MEAAPFLDRNRGGRITDLPPNWWLQRTVGQLQKDYHTGSPERQNKWCFSSKIQFQAVLNLRPLKISVAKSDISELCPILTPFLPQLLSESLQGLSVLPKRLRAMKAACE